MNGFGTASVSPLPCIVMQWTCLCAWGCKVKSYASTSAGYSRVSEQCMILMIALSTFSVMEIRNALNALNVQSQFWSSQISDYLQQKNMLMRRITIRTLRFLEFLPSFSQKRQALVTCNSEELAATNQERAWDFANWLGGMLSFASPANLIAGHSSTLFQLHSIVSSVTLTQQSIFVPAAAKCKFPRSQESGSSHPWRAAGVSWQKRHGCNAVAWWLGSGQFMMWTAGQQDTRKIIGWSSELKIYDITVYCIIYIILYIYIIHI